MSSSVLFPICYFSRVYVENKSLGNIPVFVELLIRLFICTTLNIHNCISANEPVPISDYYTTYYTHSEQNGNAFVPFTTRHSAIFMDWHKSTNCTYNGNLPNL